MNCHEDNKGKQGSHKHSTLKHMLHMALCCGLPIVVIGALPIIKRFSPEAGGILGKIAPFLCPILMLSMVPMMFGGSKKGGCCDDKKENHDNDKPLDLNRLTE